MKTAARARVTELGPLGEALELSMPISVTIGKGRARTGQGGRETAESMAMRQ